MFNVASCSDIEESYVWLCYNLLWLEFTYVRTSHFPTPSLALYQGAGNSLLERRSTDTPNTASILCILGEYCQKLNIYLKRYVFWIHSATECIFLMVYTHLLYSICRQVTRQCQFICIIPKIIHVHQYTCLKHHIDKIFIKKILIVFSLKKHNSTVIKN